MKLFLQIGQMIKKLFSVSIMIGMCFMLNKAFINDPDQLVSLTTTLDVLIIMDKTTFQQTLPISLNVSNLDSNLLTAPMTIKDFVHQLHHKREIFGLQERHTIMNSELPSKNFFLNSFTIDVFSVCYCYNFIKGYSYGNVHTMITHETQNISNQSCFTANKRSRCSN